MEGSIFYLNQIDPDWVSYVGAQRHWEVQAVDNLGNPLSDVHGNPVIRQEYTTSPVYAPNPGCDCDPNDATFTAAEKRACCLRHQNCVPRIDDHVATCRRYHDHYLTQATAELSCACDVTAGTTEDQALCKETIAACLRCALDSVAETSFTVMGTMGIDATQASVKNIPGFELMVN
jgi:hypothetical protein